MTSNEEYIKKNKVITVDDDKNTILHYAVALNNIELVQEQIATGQRLDPENYLGWTPLMMAARNGNLYIIDLLLRNRADATKKNKFEMSVFLVSITSGSMDILERILNHLLSGGVSRQSLQKTFSPVSMAILFGHSHIFKYLIERSFDINAATPLTGITPLMFASAMGNNKAVKKLMQHNANTKLKNHLGKTAQDIAQSRNRRVDIDVGNKQKPPHVPFIVISPHTPNSPYLQLTPYPVNPQQMRKSSNAITPNVFCSPNMTPIAPNFVPQMFFSSNFSPSQYASPGLAYQSTDFLNANINQSAVFSPMLQQICHPNYV